MSSIDPYGLSAPVAPLTSKAFHIPAWDAMEHPERLEILREMVEQAGRDPRVRIKAVEILRGAGVEPRQYDEQAAALLRWVQEHIYYVNEPGEILQDPLWTLEHGFADCDDATLLLMSFYEAIGLPWKFVISGRKSSGKVIRWTEGTLRPWGVTEWGHIYGSVGLPPQKPASWQTVEPTLRGAPVGWDVVQGPAGLRGKVAMPEMQRAGMGGFGGVLGGFFDSVRDIVGLRAAESAASGEQIIPAPPALPATVPEPFLSRTTLHTIGIYVIAGFLSAIASAVAMDIYKYGKVSERVRGFVVRRRRNGWRR